MSNYYLFICSDTDCIEGKESAYNIALARLEKGVWPIYRGTRNRRSIHMGDQCLFYMAGNGKHAQHTIASGEVKGIEKWGLTKGSVDNVDILSNAPDQIIRLIDIEFFDPVPIRKYLEELSFIPKNPVHSWGGGLQGGCKKLQERDYKLLTPSS